jgi:hypothetical protein
MVKRAIIKILIINLNYLITTNIIIMYLFEGINKSNFIIDFLQDYSLFNYLYMSW